METFTDNIPYYLSRSDFFIGKPGNVSISEAMAMNLPAIVECNASTLMQERFCAEWIADCQVGTVISDFQNVAEAVADLIEPENYYRYLTNIKAFDNQAVFEVADLWESILEAPLAQRSTRQKEGDCTAPALQQKAITNLS